MSSNLVIHAKKYSVIEASNSSSTTVDVRSLMNYRSDPSVDEMLSLIEILKISEIG